MPFDYNFSATFLPLPVSIGPSLTHLGKRIVWRKFALAAVLVSVAGGAQAVTLDMAHDAKLVGIEADELGLGLTGLGAKGRRHHRSYYVLCPHSG